jgi:Kelch motif protein
MPELDDTALERRLRGVLKEHLGALPLDLTVDALDRRRKAKGVARRSGRGRGMTLLAAAVLLLGGGALAAGSGILRLPSVVPPVAEPSVIAEATASPDATLPSPSESAAPSSSPIPVAGPGGVWIPVGTMVMRRGYESAVRLLDGRVLVIGRSATYDPLAFAELYDPTTGIWSATGNMVRPYDTNMFPPVVQRGGRVLVGGGDEGSETAPATAEVYDPVSGTWSFTGPMVGSDGGGRTATVLQDGKVLATGGYGIAQLYDPTSGSWTATGRLNQGRYGPATALLSDGRVLVAGGGHPLEDVAFSAEVYDPATGSWTAIANMPAPGGRPATPLLDGTVLVGNSTYDQATGTWTALPVSVNYNSAALLSDGTVMLVNNRSGNPGPDPCATADLYDPRTGSLTTVSGIPWCAVGSFTPLLDGTVLVAGGFDCQGDGEARVCVANGAAALYVPAGVSLPALPAFPTAPPPVFPSPTSTQAPIPTPRPTPFPAAVGPVPPNARSWTVTVENRSSEPAALFVADDTLRLVGSATPNVVPAGATMKVTFLFPVDGGWIYVNPRPGEGGSLVSAADIGIPGKILIRAEGDAGWLSP